MPERRMQRHGTRLAAVHQGAAEVQFPPGSRVITPEGFTGRVLFVDESFSPGNTAYQVQLDGGMGGGTYLGPQLRPAPESLRGAPGFSNLPAGVTASLEEVEAAETHLASDDYPEMGSILHDRPDPAMQIKIIGVRLHEATEIYGVPIDDQGDAPEHGLIPRAADPEGYDDRSTEGQQGDSQNDDPWMKSKDQPSSAGNPGPDSVGGADAGAAPNGGPGGGAVASRVHSEFYPGTCPSCGSARYRVPDDEDYKICRDCGFTYGKPEQSYQGKWPGTTRAFSPEPPSWLHLSSVHEARVPWTGKEREELHKYPVPAVTEGDFVPSWNFQDARQQQQHAENILVQPAQLLPSEDPGSGSLAGRAEAVRRHKAAGLRQEAVSDRQWEMHLRHKHGWDQARVDRLKAGGDRPGDMHEALHDAGLANHAHSGGPDEEDLRMRRLMEEERVRQHFGPPRIPARRPEDFLRKRDMLPDDPWDAVMQSEPVISQGVEDERAGRTPLWRLNAREDDLYRHMRMSHGVTPENMRWLTSGGGSLEDYHHIDHSRTDPFVRHDENDLHSQDRHEHYYPHPDDPDYGAHEKWPAWPPLHPGYVRFETDPDRGGYYPVEGRGEAEHLLSSTAPARVNPPDTYPLAFFSSVPGPRAFLEHLLAAGKRPDDDEEEKEPGDDVTEEVYRQLAKDYPPHAIDWVRSVPWTREDVPLDQVDWENLHHWTAWREPKKVAKKRKKIKKKLKKGKDPRRSVAVQRPGKQGIMIADGHHQSLAYAELDEPVRAFVAHPQEDDGPWDDMHTEQEEQGEGVSDDDINASDNGKDIAPGEPGKDKHKDMKRLRETGDRMLALPKGPPLTQSSTQGHQDHLQAMQQWQQPGAQDSGSGDDDSGESGDSESDGNPVKKDKTARKAALAAFSAAASSPSFAFHFTASWRDVVAKAKRIREGGGVRITASTGGLVIGQVRGDHDVYESGIQRVPGKPRSIQHWACGCPWASWHQDKSYPGHLNGRPCSHVWALQLEATARQSRRGADGRTYADPAVSMPYSEVVVKSLGPWTNGGWAHTWTAPSTYSPVLAAASYGPVQLPGNDIYHDASTTPDPPASWDDDVDYYDVPGQDNPWREAARVLRHAGMTPRAVESLILMTAGDVSYALLMRHLHEKHGIPDDVTEHDIREAMAPYETDIEEWHRRLSHPRTSAERNISDWFTVPHVHGSLRAQGDQTNAPWGGGDAHPPSQPQKPYGATEPPQKDMDPGSYGPLAGPDPENWGSIQDSSGVQMPMHTDGVLHQATPDEAKDWNWTPEERDKWERQHSHSASVTDVMSAPVAIYPAPRPDAGSVQFPQDQGHFPYADQSNAAGPSTAMDPRDPQGLRMDAAVRRERNHEDLNDSMMRLHMRVQHGFIDSPDDPDWMIRETHQEEHEDPSLEHYHPDLVGDDGHISGDQFSWKPQRYVEPARDVAGLMGHMGELHGGTFSGDKNPAAGFLHRLHESFHNATPGELPRAHPPLEHQHDLPPGHHDPVLGAKRHNWEYEVTPAEARTYGGNPGFRPSRDHPGVGYARERRCVNCGVESHRYGNGVSSYWTWNMPGEPEEYQYKSPACGPEIREVIHGRPGPTPEEGRDFLREVERQVNPYPPGWPGIQASLQRALAEIDEQERIARIRSPVQAAELREEPEGALDDDGLTAGDTPMGGGSTGDGNDAPAPLDTAALGSWASKREQLRARFGFSPVTHDVAPAGQYALDPMTTGGGPGMSQHDEDLSPWDSQSIQTMGQQQWSGGGSDPSEVDVPAGQPSGSESEIIASFQASAAARQFSGTSPAHGDGDIAAQARAFLKTGVLSDGEASELIAEGKGSRARNLDLLDLEGTHYAAEAEAMKRRGLDLDDFDEDLVVI